MHNKNTSQHGFTLVELMLAMAFFSSILFVSAATFVQLLGIYNKGVAVKQMNQAGRTLTDGFLRNANLGAYTTETFKVTRDDGNTGKVQCIHVGETMYLLSYAKDEPNNGLDDTAYKLDDGDGTLVNFVRYNSDKTPDRCPDPSDPVPASDVSPLLNDTLRVYHSDIMEYSSGMVRFSLKIGTYAGEGSEANAQIDTSGSPPTYQMSCPVDSIGNFCAFSEYQTVLYLPNISE